MATRKRTSKNTDKRLQSTLDADLTMLRMRLNKKREYIAILELELFNTRVALHEFAAKYNQRIAPLERQLGRLRRLLYEQLESQREDNGQTEPPDFGEEEPEDQEFSYSEKGENGWRSIGKKKKKSNSPKVEEQIRDLFRELARRFHPDLTSDPDEKKWREEVMTKVNQAYANRDLKALQALAEQPDRPMFTEDQTKEQEIEALKTELVRLDGVINDLKARIRHLEESPAWRLKLEARVQRRSGTDMLSQMQAELVEQIDDLQERLIVMGIDLDALLQEQEEETQEAEPAGD